MSKKTKPDVWALEITELPQSPFWGETRRHKTRFQGCLRHGDDSADYFWGHTRDEVIAKANAGKANQLAWRDAMANVERIEI